MLQQILSAYNLNENQFQIEQIGFGLINQTWRLKNSHEDYILQRINDNIFKKPLAIACNIGMLADYLLQHYPAYLFTVPIKTKNHEGMAYLPEKGYYRLAHFVRQSHTIDAAESPGQAFEAARQFGRFTMLLSNFPVEQLQITLPDFHNLSLRYTQFLQALETGNRDRITQAAEMIAFIKENRDIVDTYENILNNPAFRLRVTHHDTKISNVLFDENDKGLCVIDLDTVMPGYFISDVGDIMRTYLSPVTEEEKDFSKISIRDDYFVSIFQGYMSEMKNELTAEEKDHFIYSGKFMIYMQAIRFLTDHINNDIYYGAKYPGHNFLRAGNQIALLTRLKEKEGALMSLI
ncbi:MAG: aminoglycoside phosphotransferase family protein [Ginsengibacter sp.]